MRMIAAGLAVALASLTSTAFAAPVGAISLSPDAQRAFDKTYGAREVEHLSAYIQKALDEALTRRGLVNGALTVETTLVEAIPSRPTFEQLNDNVSLSMRSVSLGGAKLHAKLIDANGRVVDEVSFRYFEHDISRSFSSGTWTEAHHAIRRFAAKVADAYAAKASA
jgi:hypothetical protein